MAWLAFTVYLGGLGAAFGLRTWLHHRATGDSGLRHTRPPAGTIAWWAQTLFAAAVLLGAVAPVLAATGLLAPIRLLDRAAVAITGLVVAVAGLAGVVAAQSAMGRSWRIGVDPSERTDLVTGGVFGLVRNPIFTAMITASAGLTAMVPTWLQLLALTSLVAGIQLQVRAVEEPYLTATHGAAYAAYTARVGRFLPFIGRLPGLSRSPAGTA